MLYNKKWGKKTDIHSLESLIAWLETMPATGEYVYISGEDCLLAQYYTAMGLRDVVVTICSVFHAGRSSGVELSHEFSEVAIKRGRTYGAALKRAKVFQKSVPKQKEKENA